MIYQFIQEFINQNDPVEDVDNNASIIFECERCSTNLSQDTILDHQCQANENKIHKYESEIIEADKIDEVEVIVEYEEDGLEDNICHNNLRTTDSAGINFSKLDYFYFRIILNLNTILPPLFRLFFSTNVFFLSSKLCL